MLLDELTMEEKKAFWNIANVLASVDGRVMEEVSILNQYNEEMGVNFAFIDASLVDVKKEIESIKSSSLRSRKIVYFELFGVAYADTDFNDNEKAVLDEVSAGIYAIMEKNYGNVDIKPYVKDMLEAFKNKGVKMCIASATNSDLASRVLTRLGIRDYFSAVLCCKDVGRGKRYPDVYNYALNYLGTSKEETPVFEDAVFAIRTLSSHGFVSVGIEDKWCIGEEREEVKAKATYYIDSYKNWEKVLK